MGTDCAPDLANLFLFAYKYKYIMDLIDKGKSDEPRLFRFVHRYIDDLIILNDNGHFDTIFKNIYPKELELKLTSGSKISANYLDLQININNGNIIHSLYDKRNDFDFKVISMPNMKSNVPIKPTYGVFYRITIHPPHNHPPHNHPPHNHPPHNHPPHNSITLPTN